MTTTPANDTPARIYRATKTTVTIDHTDHAHPTTKAARAACRRAMSRHDYRAIDTDTITALTRSLDDDIAANATRVLDLLADYDTITNDDDTVADDDAMINDPILADD